MIRLLTFLPFLLFALGLFNPSTAKAASMYQVNNGTAVTINEWGVCQIVTNNRGIGIMVPTNTAAEWANFRAGVPSGVSLGGCYSYSWQVGGWGACSASCGGGTQWRSVWCLRSDGATVADGFCGGGRPADNQPCNTQVCTCNLPWGGTINSGQSVQAYNDNVVGCGSGCPNPVTVTCSGTTLSPAGYNYASCTETACTKGYFVMVAEDHDGDYNGLTGANTYCRNKLRAESWKGKGSSSVNVDTKVKAFLCDDSTCQNLKPNQDYYFAKTGGTGTGGASFTTDGSRRGPSDSANWSGSSYFGWGYGVWTGRESNSNTLWKNSPAGSTCNNWNSKSGSVKGDYGYMNDSGEQRWIARWNGFNEVPQGCDADQGLVRLICFVDP